MTSRIFEVNNKQQPQLHDSLSWLVPALLTKSKIKERKEERYTHILDKVYCTNGYLTASDGRILKAVRLFDEIAQFKENTPYILKSVKKTAIILEQCDTNDQYPDIHTHFTLPTVKAYQDKALRSVCALSGGDSEDRSWARAMWYINNLPSIIKPNNKIMNFHPQRIKEAIGPVTSWTGPFELLAKMEINNEIDSESELSQYPTQLVGIQPTETEDIWRRYFIVTLYTIS